MGQMDMHVDNALRKLQVAFAIRDVISDLSIDIRTNLDLRTIAEQEQLVLNDELALRLDCKVSPSCAEVCLFTWLRASVVA